jgi:D-alanyl-D-alanine carboxypeptidase
MNERNYEQSERYRRGRKRKTNRPVILILIFSIIIAITILWFLISKGSEKHVILNTTDIQPNLTIGNDISAGIEGRDNLQFSTDNTEWELTLVNKWNPLPENYKINLVEIPGGEKVDERIYEPLMEMLEAAKEGNWDQLPEVVSGY